MGSPGVIIPVMLCMGMSIYYLFSTSKALKASNNDLAEQIQREKEEEKLKLATTMANKDVKVGCVDIRKCFQSSFYIIKAWKIIFNKPVILE